MMAISFRRQPPPPETPSGPPPEPSPVWVAPATKEQAEERLFHFLRSLGAGRPQADRPLLLEGKTLRALYASPNPDLVEAFRYRLEHFLLEVCPDAGCWGDLEVSPVVWGVAVAAYNCLTPMLVVSTGTEDPVSGFLTALVETLPPARTAADALAYHVLLQAPAEALPVLPPGRAGPMRALLHRSPLSAVYHLHLDTPPPLGELAAERLPGWRGRTVDPAPWRDLDDWLDALELLEHPGLAAWLRRRWLALPETRAACRNRGLVLEALRRRGDWREFLLEYYEAYCYLAAETAMDPVRGPFRRWPLLGRIEQLLRADGDSETAIRLNRWGNEYFLLFRALIQTVIAEDGMPKDYRHLTVGFVLAVRRLLDLTTEAGGPRMDLANVEFGEGEE
jgi:hypothetical protein